MFQEVPHQSCQSYVNHILIYILILYTAITTFSLDINLYIKGTCVSRQPVPALNLYFPSPALICFYQPWHLIWVCLFFVLQLKFVIVTVFTYINSVPILIYSLFKYKIQLLKISSQDIFSIFLIGYSWSHSVHFHFVIQLLQLFY